MVISNQSKKCRINLVAFINIKWVLYDNYYNVIYGRFSKN